MIDLGTREALTTMSLFPLASFDLIANDEADALLVLWGHWLGACHRPFGRQSFGLALERQIISVAVSASTINATCGGLPRQEIVELARCASHPHYRWATRVCLRLWRELAPACWARKYWPVTACVSYSNALRHTGNLYRFDGWTKVADVAGGTAGGNWSRGKKYDPKSVWVWSLAHNNDDVLIMRKPEGSP